MFTFEAPRRQDPGEHEGNTKGPADTAPGAGAALTPFTAASH